MSSSAIIRFKEYSVYGWIDERILNQSLIKKGYSLYYIDDDLVISKTLTDKFKFSFITKQCINTDNKVEKVIYEHIADTLSHIKYLIMESVEEVITDPKTFFEESPVNNQAISFGFEALNEKYKVTIERLSSDNTIKDSNDFLIK